jgi:LPS O-antigen subunit length determinant protein (WzzB/FepE family)
MKQDVEEAEQAIAYLNKQIEATSLAELHVVFFRLIEEQMKTVMLAKVSDEYLLKTLDPAVAPEEKEAPNRALIVLLSAFFSGILAMFLVVVMGSSRLASNNRSTI